MKTTVIIENEFIENLFITQSDNLIRSDFYNFLISDFSGYNLICDFKDVDEYTKVVHENPIWELILDKIEYIYYNPTLINDIELDDFYKPLGEHNVFLVTLTHEKCVKLSKSKGYLYMSMDCIDKVWSNFTLDKRNNVFKVSTSRTIPDNLRFDSWSKLENFSAPLTSILIFDKYILNDLTGQKLAQNLFPLLEKLLINLDIDAKLTLTIICEPKGWDIEERQKRLNSFFISKGYSSIKVNIVKHFKAFYPKDLEGLHGRVIFTNYYHIRCDDSFNLFNHKKVNNDADIKINFSLSNKNRCFYEKELNDIRRYVSKLLNNESNPKEDYKKLYFPCKNNYFLN